MVGMGSAVLQCCSAAVLQCCNTELAVMPCTCACQTCHAATIGMQAKSQRRLAQLPAGGTAQAKAGGQLHSGCTYWYASFTAYALQVFHKALQYTDSITKHEHVAVILDQFFQ